MRCCYTNIKKKITALEADAVFTSETCLLMHKGQLAQRNIIKKTETSLIQNSA